MPQKGQKTITISDSSVLNLLEKVSIKEKRSQAQIVELLVLESFSDSLTDAQDAARILQKIRGIE